MTTQSSLISLLVSIGLMVFTNTARAETPSPIATTQPTSDSAPHSFRSENPPGIVDRLEQVTDADAWSAGTLANANVFPDSPARVELGYRESDFPRSGSWTGPIKDAAFPFDELIASFNVTTPTATGAVLEMRVLQNGIWSPWAYMQCWGKTLASPGRVTQWDGGRVKVDTLMLDKPATKYQARVTLVSFAFEKAAPKPSVRRLSICYSGIVTDAQQRAHLLGEATPSTQPSAGNWVRDLEVPFRAQGEDAIPKPLRKLICSPTSTSMVLSFYGTDRPTLDNASAIYDPVYGLFGNWGRAISRAGEVGLDAYLTRFRNWDQVHAMIARGIPVVASIRFNKGEVKGFLYESTRGHLLVIRGFKTNGDVIVNDPARKAKGNGVVYPADQFAKAWFDHGGVAYVIQKPENPATVVRKSETKLGN